MRIARLFKRIFIILIILYIAICSVAYFLQEKLLFFPEKLSADFKFQFDYPFEESNITCSNGDTLNQLLFHADSAKGVVIYFHGNAGSLRTWGTSAEHFLKNNYDVAITDYACYGKSKGHLSEKNLLADAQAVFDNAKRDTRNQRLSSMDVHWAQALPPILLLKIIRRN